MKKYYFILLIGISALFNSCVYDFEEGSDISFRTISRRVEGKWYIRGVWVNGIDSSGYFPYNQYTQKDSLTLEFIFNEDYNTEKVSYIKSSVDYRLDRDSKWTVRNDLKRIQIINNIRGFDPIFFEIKTASYWKIIGCRNKRLVFDLSEYYSNSNKREKATKSIRILLIAA
jgi:hypothetical protein